MPPVEVSWVLFCRDILQLKSAAWNDKYTFYWKQLNEYYIKKLFVGLSFIWYQNYFLDPKIFLDQTIFRIKWCLWEQIFINWIFLGIKIYLDLYIISNSKFLLDSKNFWEPPIFFISYFLPEICFWIQVIYGLKICFTMKTFKLKIYLKHQVFAPGKGKRKLFLTPKSLSFKFQFNFTVH